MTTNNYVNYDILSSVMDITTFADWLQNELNERGWSQSDLARTAGVHRQVINSYINQKRSKPDEDILRLIARAFGYSPEMVFRAAGLLPPKPEGSELTEKIVHLVNQMDEVDRTDVYEYAELVFRRRQQRDLFDEFKTRLAGIPPDQKGEIVRALYEYLPVAGARRKK